MRPGVRTRTVTRTRRNIVARTDGNESSSTGQGHRCACRTRPGSRSSDRGQDRHEKPWRPAQDILRARHRRILSPQGREREKRLSDLPKDRQPIPVPGPENRGATKSFHRPYRVFGRNKFLKVLRSYKGNHQALRDYRDYLERWERSTSCFRHWKEDDQSAWSWASWEGFYQYLEDTLGDGDWRYVPNPSGGFVGFWWNSIPVNGSEGPEIYLQLEADLKKRRHLLCFKVYSPEKKRWQELKWHWHKRILEAGDGRVERPRVMRAGSTSTVGHWKGEWIAFNNGTIDLSRTVANLRVGEQIISRAGTIGT